MREASWTSAFVVQITLQVMASELTGQRHGGNTPSRNIVMELHYRHKLLIQPSFVTTLFLHEKLYRAVLAAASPSLLGPSLLQEGSEAEDMVSVTVPMLVIVMTVIMMRMILCSIDFELLQKSPY